MGENQSDVPIVSIYFLLLLTILDIFLFIYFLHHITQSFKYDQQIQKMQSKAHASLARLFSEKGTVMLMAPREGGHVINSDKSGYYQGFFRKKLQAIATEHDLIIELLHPIGTHLLQGMPVLKVYGEVIPQKEILAQLDYYFGQEIDKNIYYGFFHLTEVAVKALSPGINDPGTAVLVVNALSDLFKRILDSPLDDALMDEQGKIRIITKQLPVPDIFEKAILPIWDYGKNDRLVKEALILMLRQLLHVFANDPRVGFLKRWLTFFESNGAIEAENLGET